MNEAVKTTMRRLVAGTLALVMVLTALLLVFVRPKAEDVASQLPALNEMIVGTVKFQSFNFLGDNTTGEDGTDYSATFYYTDDYFARSAINENVSGQKVPWSELDNTSLATCSMNFAVASYTSAEGDVISASSRTWDNSDYSEKDKNVIAFLETCGFGDIKPSDTYFVEPSQDSIAYTIANKKINVWDEESQANKEYTLVAVGIRGAGYGPEWASNVTVGDSSNPSVDGRHKGFDDSAQQVVAGLENYIAEHNISGDVKYWVSGFSRSAAVANLTAGYITDRAAEFGTQQKDIYGYTYECPQCAETSEDALAYKNIHNIVNQMDMVPRVSPSEFHHQRLGVDYIMPYHGNTTSAENEEYYNRMYRVLQTIAVGKTFRGEYTEDPLISAVNPSNYPYNRTMTPYKLSATKLVADAIAGRLMTEFGTEESKKNTGIFSGGNVDHVLGDLDDNGTCDWYLDDMLDEIVNVFLVSNAWDRGYGNTTSDIDVHKVRFIESYQDDMRTVLGYLLGFSGPAFLGLVDSLMGEITSVLRLSNAGVALAFVNFYNDPTGSYSRYNLLVDSSWRGKTYKDVLINESKGVAVDLVNRMTAGYTHPTISRAQMNASLETLVGLVVDLFADELDRYESQYFGTFLRLMNVILSTHEQETVLSWITSLDENHMNRSYRTLTVPGGTNVKLYEFREEYGETLSADGVAPLVAEFANGAQVSSLDQRIYMESNGSTMTIRYPSSLDIRSDVTLAPGSAAVSDLDYRVADYQTKQDTTDVSVGATQFQTLSNNNRYTDITNTSRTNAAAINSASAADAVVLGPYDTLKVMANATTSFDNHNAGDENVYTVVVERYHTVTLQEVLEEGSDISSASFDVGLTLTPPYGTEVPATGMDILYENTIVHFTPVADPAGQGGTPTYVSLTATLEDLNTGDPPVTLILPEGWTLTMNQPSDGSYQTVGYTVTPAGGTASEIEGDTASVVVSTDTAVVIRNWYYLPPPTGFVDEQADLAFVLLAIVVLCGGACGVWLFRKKDVLIEE